MHVSRVRSAAVVLMLHDVLTEREAIVLVLRRRGLAFRQALKGVLAGFLAGLAASIESRLPGGISISHLLSPGFGRWPSLGSGSGGGGTSLPSGSLSRTVSPTAARSFSSCVGVG